MPADPALASRANRLNRLTAVLGAEHPTIVAMRGEVMADQLARHVRKVLAGGALTGDQRTWVAALLVPELLAAPPAGDRREAA